MSAWPVFAESNNRLNIDNQTFEKWQVAITLEFPPKMGEEGVSEYTMGHIDYKSATVAANSNANIFRDSGGFLKTLSAKSSQTTCRMDEIGLLVTKPFTLTISADEIVLKDASGQQLGKCP